MSATTRAKDDNDEQGEQAAIEGRDKKSESWFSFIIVKAVQEQMVARLSQNDGAAIAAGSRPGFLFRAKHRPG